MKRILKTVMKEVQQSVQVCDVCEREVPLIIQGSWNSYCRYDACTSNGGQFEFCSFRCFQHKAKELAEDLDSEWESTYIDFRMQSSQSGFDDFIKAMRAYGEQA